MRLRNLSLKKILAVIATLATLVNSLSAPALAFAQEVSPTPSPTTQASPTDTPTAQPTDSATPTSQPTVSPTDTSTPTATPDASITPTPSDQPSPTDSATPTATDSATPTDLASPTASPEAQPTDQPSAQPTDNSNQSNSQPTDSTQPSASLTPSPSAQPTSSPQAPIEQGTLSETIITGVDLSGVTGLKTGVDGSGTITTNQSDYSPTSLVLITGSGFIANKTYTIEIVSTDAPPVNFTDQVKADNSGNISYAYQLDGNYRPNYTAYIKDGAVVVVTTTFTDGAYSLDQCANGTTTPALGNLNKKCGDNGHNVDPDWQNGDINGSNSQYREGDGLPYRVSVTGISSGAHTLKIDYDFTKGGVFAIDRLTGFDLTQKSDPCGDGSAVNCSFGSAIVAPADMPSEVASIDSTHPALPNSGNLFTFTGSPAVNPGHLNDLTNSKRMSAWTESGQTFTWGTFDTNVVQNGLSSADSDRQFSFSFTVGSCPNNGCDVMFGWTGHIASSQPLSNGGWGTGKGATSIQGAPFHMTIDNLDGSGGAQARSVQIAALVQAGTLTINKTAIGGDGTFGYTVSGPTPSTPSITTSNGSGSTGGTTVNAGTYTVSESTIPANWSLTNSSCTDGTNTFSPTSFSILTGQAITCNFTNTFTQPTGTITIVKNTSGGNGTFNFTVTGPTGSSQQISTSGGTGTTGAISVNSGSYSVSETVPSGWTLTSSSCTSGTPSSFTVPTNGNVTCTFSDSKLPTLTVNKVLSPSNDPGKFNLLIDSNTGATNVGDGGTTGAQTVSIGSHTVSETAGTATTLSDYTAVIGGNCASDGSITLAAGDNKTCTITNTRNTGTIELKKVWSGTPGQTTLNIGTTASGSNVASTQTGADGGAPLTTGQQTVNTGTYYVSETGGLTDYTPALNCTDDGTPIAVLGSFDSVDVTTGHAIVCTFTNTRNQGTIEVIKDVTPDDFGATNWDINISGPTTNSATLSDDQNTGVLNSDTGSYTITESAHAGTDASNYTSTYSCVNGTTPVTSGSGMSLGFTLSTGQNIVCTFTNTRKTADLKVYKVVDDGSVLTDWSFSLDGGNAVKADATGLVDFGQVTTNANHTITEGGANQSNYTLVSVTGTPVSCSQNGTNSGTVNIPNGSTGTTCTFTNDRNTGTVTVTKNLVPSIDSGTFNLQINSSTFATGGDGTTTGAQTLPTGTITVGETGANGTDLANYSSSIVCDNGTNGVGTSLQFNLATGNNITCTITNTRKTGNITIDKIVSGGLASPTDWTFTILNVLGSFISGDTTTLNTGNYTITESGPTGYTLSGVSGICSNPSGSSATLGVTTDGGTCTFTNTRDTGTITIIKNATGGDGIFNFSVSGETASTPQIITNKGTGTTGAQTVNTGTYGISETIPNGWTLTSASCSSGQATFSPDEFIVNKGENVICTFNDSKLPTLTVNKVLSPNTDPGLFNLLIDGNVDAANVTDGGTTGAQTLSIGSHTVSETAGTSTNLSDYTAVFSGDCATDGSITLAAGDNKTCTITNTRNTGSLLVNKLEDTTGSGNYDTFNSSDFTWGTDPSVLGTAMGVSQTLNTGNYNVYENSVPGYSFTGWFYGNPEENDFSCSEPEYTTLPTDLSVFSGETTEITLCNQFEMPTLNITKSNSTPNVNAGDKATYTLTVTNSGKATVPNITVKDVIPGGFSYVTGSTTGSTTSDPAVSGNVLTWSGVTIAAGQSWSITYQTQASSTLTSGSYTNFASCSTVFRDKTLKCDPDPVSSTVTIGGGTSYGGNIQGQVLGASTSVLPATGSPTLLLIGALSLIATGLFINGSYKRKERTNVKN